jgi:hypothetical protein
MMKATFRVTQRLYAGLSAATETSRDRVRDCAASYFDLKKPEG